MTNIGQTAQPKPHRDGGFILIIASVGLLVLLVMAAASVDVGNWYNRSHKAQRAADAAAMAAVTELNRVQLDTGSRTQGETAGRAMAVAVARENGFDVANGRITVTTTFTASAGATSDIARVQIREGDVPLFFAGLVTRNVNIERDASAAMGACQATCDGTLVIPPPLGTTIDTGTGGDGYMAVRTGNYLFNLFHHTSNPPLQCTDLRTNTKCNPGNVSYPARPYLGMQTNYTPGLTPYEGKVYFVAQKPGTAGLGCWDSETHALCAGFSVPKQFALYKANGAKNALSRMDGPHVVGDRIFAYGDDNRMYCYDPETTAMCTGYPRNTGLKGVHDMALKTPAEGFAGGVNASGVQFDMLVHPVTLKIYTVLGPTADNLAWVGCFDTITGAACTDWPTAGVSVPNVERLLFFRYPTNGTLNTPSGVCTRGGKLGGGDGGGHSCFSMTGTVQADFLPWDFSGFGEQESTAPTSTGQLFTYFPDRGASAARCWNWTTGAQCAIPPTNWSGTDEYGYWWDGGGCMIGLGHAGKVWSFRVDDGQKPCAGNSAGHGVIHACVCADGVTRVWTALTVTDDTDLSLFTSFRVTIRRPDGTVFATVELVGMANPVIDLSALNLETPVPEYVTVTAHAVTPGGNVNDVWFTTEGPAVTMIGGTRPTLVE